MSLTKMAERDSIIRVCKSEAVSACDRDERSLRLEEAFVEEDENERLLSEAEEECDDHTEVESQQQKKEKAPFNWVFVVCCLAVTCVGLLIMVLAELEKDFRGLVPPGNGEHVSTTAVDMKYVDAPGEDDVEAEDMVEGENEVGGEALTADNAPIVSASLPRRIVSYASSYARASVDSLKEWYNSPRSVETKPVVVEQCIFPSENDTKLLMASTAEQKS